MTLLEAARKYGVETEYVYKTIMDVGSNYGHELRKRPDLEVAHDILAKLNDCYELEWNEGDLWTWIEYEECKTCGHQHQLVEIGTFIEAVLALAERA